MTYTKTILNGVKFWVEGKLNKLETLIEDTKIWANNTFVSYKLQTLTDDQKGQAQENIGIVIATDQNIIDLMLDMDMMPVIQDTDGTILVDSDDTIILT